MKSVSVTFLLLVLCLPLPACRKFHHRPNNVPSSAAWVDGAFVFCQAGTEIGKYSCTVYKDTTGEVLVDGLFVLSHSLPSDKTGLRYAYYQGDIGLEDARALTLVEASEYLFEETLKTISSHGNTQAIDCGRTTISKPDEGVFACVESASQKWKPFKAIYSNSLRIPLT
jgi:hypothetical protein